MDVPQLSPQLIDALRTWFHPKDRSIYLAPSTFAYLPGGIGYLSMAFISETILSASAASVTFSNIPQSFRHLFLTTQGRTDAATEIDDYFLRFNGDSGANYNFQQLFAFNATVATTSARGTTGISFGTDEGASSRANLFASTFGFILNYSVAGREKNTLSMTGAFGNLSADADMYVLLRSGHWQNTNVVTSLVLSPVTGPNFVSGSRFQLYGVL